MLYFDLRNINEIIDYQLLGEYLDNIRMGNGIKLNLIPCLYDLDVEINKLEVIGNIYKEGRKMMKNWKDNIIRNLWLSAFSKLEDEQYRRMKRKPIWVWLLIGIFFFFAFTFAFKKVVDGTMIRKKQIWVLPCKGKDCNIDEKLEEIFK